MRGMCVLNVTLILTSVHVESQPPVFLLDPVSVAAVDGTTVEFSCTASDAVAILYFVNGSSATDQDVQGKGFIQIGGEPLSGTARRRNLTVSASSQYNNTEIFCQAIGSNNGISETADLTIQGPLSSVGNLSTNFINSSTVNISWSPPFTLPGTAITGYNTSVTSNETTTNYFTSDSYYVLQLSDLTDSPCNEINITVSGYNGLNGETESISVPSSNPAVSLSVDVLENLQLTVGINVTSICTDERPTSVDIALFRDDTEVFIVDVMFSNSPSAEILTINIPNTVEEDMIYTIEVSFSIFDGDFDVSGKQLFNTFGIQSVDLNDTTEDSVFCICIFKSFSTDIGCTIQLLLSGIVQYVETFTKSGKTATGNIFGVATGLYQVRVFDQGNPTVVLTSELMVIGEPATTTTTTSVTSSAATDTPTVPVVTSVTPPVNPNQARESSTTTCIVIAVTMGTVIVILLAVVLSLVACLVQQKKYHKNPKGNKFDSSNVLALAGSDFGGTLPTLNSLPQSFIDDQIQFQLKGLKSGKDEKRKNDLSQNSSTGATLLVNVNPAYGKIKNTDTTGTVYDTIQ